jgi:hypothetical protein
MRASGVQLGGSLAGKLSFRPSSIFQSDDFASGVGRGRRCLRRAIAACGRTDVRCFDIMAPAARQALSAPWWSDKTIQSERQDDQCDAEHEGKGAEPPGEDDRSGQGRHDHQDAVEQRRRPGQ